MKCEFEFTARNTPQQNSLAEVGFATLANHGQAMMHRANVPMMDRYRLAHEAFQCATHLPRQTDGGGSGWNHEDTLRTLRWTDPDVRKTSTNVG